MSAVSSVPFVLSPESVGGVVWCFVRDSGQEPRYPVRLLEGGKIEGYGHANERSWAWVDGHLAFLTGDGRVSTLFDRVVSECPLVLEGDFLLPRKEGALVHRLCALPFFPKRVDPAFFRSQTRLELFDAIQKYGWSVGEHTYGKPMVVEPSQAKLVIGRFCSIAPDVVIALGDHRLDSVSSYPFKSLRRFWPESALVSHDHVSKGDVVIGNDVWLGHGAMILSGVSIGDGAVVAAKSVVTRDVPAYALVAGNPARVVRLRFDERTVERLLALRWWDWPDDKVDVAVPLLSSGNLEDFFDAFE